MNSTISGSDNSRERGLCGATTNNINLLCDGDDDTDDRSVGSIQFLFAKCCTSTKNVHDDTETGGDLRLRPDSPYDEGPVNVVTPTADATTKAANARGDDDSIISVSSDDTIDFAAEFAATVKQEQEEGTSIHIKKYKSPYDKMQEIKDDQEAAHSTYQGKKKLKKKKSPYKYDMMQEEEEESKRPLSLPRLVTPPRMRSDVQDSTFDNLPEYTNSSGTNTSTNTISAHKPTNSCKIGLIFTRQHQHQHSKKQAATKTKTMIARVTNECIFASHHKDQSLEGATVLAVNGIAVESPRHAAELVCGALAGTVSLTIQRTCGDDGATSSTNKPSSRVTSPKEKIGMLPKVGTDVVDPQIEEYEYDSDEISNSNNSTGTGQKMEKEGVAAAAAAVNDGDDDAHSTSEFSTAEWSAAEVVENAFAFPKDDDDENEHQASEKKNAGSNISNKKERDAIATCLPGKETPANFSAPVDVNDEVLVATTEKKDAKKSKMSSIKKRVAFSIKGSNSAPKDNGGAKAVAVVNMKQPTPSDVAATPIVVSAQEIMNDLISLASSTDVDDIKNKKEVITTLTEGEQPAEGEPAAERGTKILSETLTSDAVEQERKSKAVPSSATSNPLEEITMATERATSYILEHIVSNLSSGCDDPVTGSKVLVVEDGKFHYPNDSSSSEVSSKESSAVGGQGGDSSLLANNSDSSDAEQSAGSEVKASQEAEEKTRAKKKSFFKRAFSKKSKQQQQQPLVVSDEQGDGITPQGEDSFTPELDKDAVAKSMEAAVMNDQDDSQIDVGQEKNNDEALVAKETSSNEDYVTQAKKKKSFLKLFKKSKAKKASELLGAANPVNEPVENEKNEANETTLDEESVIVPFDLDVTLTGDVEVHTPSKKQPILFDCPLSPIIPVTSPSKIDKRSGSHTTASVSMTDESNSTYDKHTNTTNTTTTTTPEDARLSTIQPTPPTPSKIGESWNSMSLLFGLSGPPSPSESIMMIGSSSVSSPSSSFLLLGSTPVSVKKTHSIEGIGGPESFECRLDDDNSTGQDRVNVSMELYSSSSNEETTTTNNNNTGNSGSGSGSDTALDNNTADRRQLHAPPPVNRKLDFEEVTAANENFGGGATTSAFNNDTMCQAPFQSKAIDVTTVYTVDDSSLVARDNNDTSSLIIAARDASLVRAPSNDIAAVEVDETLQLAQAKKDAFDIASEARRELKNSTRGQFGIGLLKRRLFEREEEVAVDVDANVDTTHVTADLTQDVHASILQ